MGDINFNGMPDGVTSDTSEDEMLDAFIKGNKAIQNLLTDNNLFVEGIYDDNLKFHKNYNTNILKSQDSLQRGFKSMRDSIRNNIYKPLTTINATLQSLVNSGILQQDLTPEPSPDSALGITDTANMNLGFVGEEDEASGKKNPTESDVMKTGKEGTNTLFLGSKLDDLLEDSKPKKKKKGLGEMLGGLFGGAGAGGLAGIGAKILPKIAKALPIAGLIAGLIWAVFDGIKGAKLAKEWGVSKLSGIMGAVIGGTDKGMKGMFKGMGKWALIGAGVGSIVPGIGTLIGGLVGAAFGGIMGFFGGEKIAKAFDALGGMFKNGINAFKNWVTGMDFAGRWESAGGDPLIFLMDVIPDVFSSIFNGVTSAIASISDSEWVSSIKEKYPLLDKIGEVVKSFFQPFIDHWKTFFANLDFMEIWTSDESIMTKIGLTIRDVVFAWIDGLKEFFTGIGANVKEFFTKDETGESSAGRFVEGAKETGKDVLDTVGKGLGELWRGILGQSDVDVTKGEDMILRKDGSLVHTSPDDNIIATKNDPSEVSMNGSSSNLMIEHLASAVGMLSQKVSDLKPQIVQQTNVMRGFASDPNLMTFPVRGQ